jgi:phosphoglucomutase
MAIASRISPLAGHLPDASQLISIESLVDAYHAVRPDPSVPAQRVAFGTSGHRGSSFNGSFNEAHIVAITQAVCEHRKRAGIDGPLFMGIDTHALSGPAYRTALEVLAGNAVDVLIANDGEYTPTPAISHAVLIHNRGRTRGLGDGIVVTPSHNPPQDGGFKYNPPNGGPADTSITQWIQDRANALLAGKPDAVRRIPFERALKLPGTRLHDFVGSYVADLGNVIDFDVVRAAGLRLGVDPLGGAGVHYWPRIASDHGIDLDIVSLVVDPQFAFMPLDWDGQIRMDPSSQYAMQRLIGMQDRYDIAWACDTDHDRHGVVAPGVGLIPSNRYLSVVVDHLLRHRPLWSPLAGIGKTVVSTSMIDRIAGRHGRRLFETPVGFKWFANGLFDGSLGFGCEESAGGACLRRDGTVWTTDKDGIVLGLLAAEITARQGRNPADCYDALSNALGVMYSDRVEAPADDNQKQRLSRLAPDAIGSTLLAGEPILQTIDKAPGNGAPIGGIKVIADGGWFAARPSGTEAIYKIYAESDRSQRHLEDILRDAQAIVDKALATG